MRLSPFTIPLALVLVLLLSISILAGCAQQKEEAQLEKCRAVLEVIQSNNHYHVEIENHFSGEPVLNSTAQIESFRSGENWLRRIRIPEASETHTELHWEGHFLTGIQYAQEEPGWEVQPILAESQPWLYTFDLDAQEVRYLGTETGDGGYDVRLQVNAPYPTFGYGTPGSSYCAIFSFNQEDTFQQATVRYTCTHETLDGSSGEENITSVFKICQTAPNDIQRKILAAYERAKI